MKSMRRLQELSPKIKELQTKYKGDKQRQNEEMMKFYKENQVNPLGSCLPLLLQLPVFISLFYMLRTDLKHDMCPGIGAYAKSIDKDLGSVTCSSFQNGFNAAHPHAQVHFDTGFLFIPDLTAKATGAVLITLIILYISTQLASTLLMSVTTDRTQRLIFIALPFFFVIFIINFPAGLLVYWITTNAWTMGQQYFIKRAIGPPVPATTGPKTDDGGGGRGGGGGGADGDSGPNGSGGIGGLLRGGRAKAADKATEEEREPVSSGSRGGRVAAPPRPPRKKKKRSGRRR
jgi:YidC/Oxa1 family membrane protein insertase